MGMYKEQLNGFKKRVYVASHGSPVPYRPGSLGELEKRKLELPLWPQCWSAGGYETTARRCPNSQIETR